MNELVTIRKIEESRLAIWEVKSLDEIKKIIDQSEALKAYSKSAQLSAELQSDINELNLRAKRRLGEISAALEKSKGGEWTHKNHLSELRTSANKTSALAEVGVSRQRANEAEKLARIPEKVFEDKLARAKAISEKVTNTVFKNVLKEMSRDEKAQKKNYTRPDSLPADYKLYAADIKTQLPQIADNSVDCIITDPPYPREYIPLYGELANLASRILKPGGSLLAMCGQSYLPDVISQLCGYMSYHWCLAYLTPGGQSPMLWNKKTNTFWKPVLWFTKGKYEGDSIGDVLKSPANDKDFHKWGQSLGGFREIIEKFTYPGQLIVDPFLGGGTTGVAAVTMNRRFIGVDIEQANIDVSRERIGEALCRK